MYTRLSTYTDRPTKTATVLAAIMLTLLAVNPALTHGENHINLLLCAALCLSPAVLLLPATRILIPCIDIPLAILGLTVIATPLLFHPQTVRWSTMLFTCAYCVYFMMLARVLKASHLDGPRLMRLIKGITYAFFVVLVIQQMCLLLGLPVFMPGQEYQIATKLNSLTSEPSHTSVTLCMLMFAFTQTQRLSDTSLTLLASLRQDWMLWGAWAWTIFSTCNASAFVLAPLAFVPFITKANLWKWCAAAAIAVTAVALIPKDLTYNVERIRNFTTAMVTLDTEQMEEADASMASRIVPTVWGARRLSPDGSLMTGHGVDADLRDIDDLPFWDFKYKSLAGHLSLLYNYGLISAIAFWAAIAFATLSRRNWWSIISFAFALQLSADYNMQLVWMIMAFAYTLKTKIYPACRQIETKSVSLS